MPERLSSERLTYLRRRSRETRLVHITQVLLLLGAFALWELAARMDWIDSFLLSSPSRMWETLVGLYQSGDLWLHLGTSCLETAVGFLLGTAAGTVIAILLWLSPRLYRIIDPYLVVLSALPKTALPPRLSPLPPPILIPSSLTSLATLRCCIIICPMLPRRRSLLRIATS